MNAKSRSCEMERLLIHSGWLRELALALTRDAATADDVAQETWLRVLERPLEAIASPRAWLARVLRRVVGERRRDELARLQRERARSSERSEAVDDPRWVERVEAQAHWQRHLVSAVLALPEPSRSTIVLRYFEGRTAAEIAQRCGAPESTVRNRVRRALQELRASLERDGVDASTLSSAILAPSALRASKAPLGVSSAMGIATKVALSVGVVLIVLPLLWHGSEPTTVQEFASEPPTPATLDSSSDVVAEVSGRAVVAMNDPTDQPVKAPVRAAPPTRTSDLPAGVVEVRVVRLAGPSGAAREAITNGVAWIEEPDQSLTASAEDEPHSRRLDAEGGARFDEVEAGPHSVGVRVGNDGALLRRITVPRDVGLRVVFELGQSSLHGEVRDFEGALVPAARVQLTGPRAGETALTVVIRTDESGRFEIRQLVPGSYGVDVDLSGEQNAQGGDYSTSVELASREVRELNFGTPRGLPAWRGVVRTTSGASAVQGASNGALGVIHVTRVDRTGYRSFAWRADGSFELRLEPGLYSLALSLPGRGERTDVLREFAFDGESWDRGLALERDLELPGATICGSARAGEWVTVRDAADTESKRPALVSMKPASDGAFRFDGIKAGRWRLAQGERSFEVVLDERDTSLTFDLR